MFEPGTKVICVDGSFPASIFNYFQNLPRKGEIYTVRDVVPGWDMEAGGETCAVLIDQISNTPNKHGIEPGFAPRRFREIEPPKQKADAFNHQETFTFTAIQPVHINCRCVIVP